MHAVPLELRLRIVEAYEQNEGTYFELARRFGVAEATVCRLLRSKREQGHVTPGRASRIGEQELAELAGLVSEFPDASLEQLKQAWFARHQRELSRSSILRALRRAGIDWKRPPAPSGAASKPRSAEAPARLRATPRVA